MGVCRETSAPTAERTYEVMTMICETCTHADNVYPGCIDCEIGADPFWNDEEEREDCTYYHESETLTEDMSRAKNKR